MVRRALRPNRVSLVLSLVCTVGFGCIGVLIRFLSSCHTGLDGGQNCQDYSLIGILVGDLLPLPAALLGWIASLVQGASEDSGPIRVLGWMALPLLWAYYYLILALISAFLERREQRNAPLSLR